MVAVYNPATDQILGCEEFSMIWWHERGHQWLHRRTGYQWRAFAAQEQLNLFALIFLIADNRLWALVCVGLMWGVKAFDEFFAWAYALAHWDEWLKHPRPKNI